jgi:carbon storage regulator
MMLVLSRRAGERVLIDGGIEVTVTEIRANCVKLGIITPTEVAVHRKEVMQRINLQGCAPIAEESL